jgi:hypothetical protein
MLLWFVTRAAMVRVSHAANAADRSRRRAEHAAAACADEGRHLGGLDQLGDDISSRSAADADAVS